MLDEVEQTNISLEEKSEPLDLLPKYKSKFLANMSHELRTPLNSILIMAEMLQKNSDKNLSAKQIESAEIIHTSGMELLALINDILSLSKIEYGVVTIECSNIILEDLAAWITRSFEQIAKQKKLKFEVVLAENLPPSMQADVKRTQQIIKNLISNALKFTEIGSVTLKDRKSVV